MSTSSPSPSPPPSSLSLFPSYFFFIFFCCNVTNLHISNVVYSLKGELLRLKLDTAVKQVTAMKSALGVLKTHGRKQ